MKKIIEMLKSPRNNTRDLSFIIFITVLLSYIFALVNPNFIDKYNLISIGQNLAPYALLALGVLMPVTVGGTDLSIGAVCIGSAVVAGKLYSDGMALWMCIPVMLIFGSLIGFINGWFIAKRNMQPFIVTLGTMMLVRGATAIFANSPTVYFSSGTWYNYLFSSYNGFPTSYLWILLFACTIYFIYRKTKIGRYLVSIGSGEKATRISGVNVDLYKIVAYTGAGFMAGVAAIFWTASFATVTVATGNGMELDAIASVYIGGTSATGGLANVFGAIIGSLMLVIIRSGLNFALAKLNIAVNSTYVTYVISGIIVVVAVLAEQSKTSEKAKNKKNDPNKQAKKGLLLYIASIVLTILLIITGLNNSKTEEIADNKTICVVMKSEGISFWSDVTAGAKQAGEDYGYKVITRGTESEDPSMLPKQLEIFNTLMSENPVGMGISTIADGFVDSIKQASEKGIKLVQYDSGLFANDLQELESSGQNPLVSYIKASNYNNAATVAEKVFPQIKDEIATSDKYYIGIIQHENTTNAEQRSLGFKDKILELAENDPNTKGKVEIIIEVKPYSATAYKEALEYLFEKDCRFIFLASEQTTNQVSDAVVAADGKYDEVKFASYDIGDKVKEWLQKESGAKLLGAISQNPYQIGYLTVKTLVDIDLGKDVDAEIIVAGEWFDSSNADLIN